MVIRSPQSILDTRVRELVAFLPRVRAADVDAVHDARVTMRRIRELLPLAEDQPVVEELRARITQAGRVIGKTRELDVLELHIAQAMTRATFASDTLTRLSHDVRMELTRRRRKVVKALERLEVEAVDKEWRSVRRSARRGRHWVTALRDRIARRAEAARAAVARADGVYLPNRSHEARIAVKKLRYALEVAGETGVWRPPHLLKDLRRVQEALGEIHDIQILVERVEDLDVDPAVPHQVGWLLDLLRAEIGDRHRQFLEKLERLRGALEACERWAKSVQPHRRGIWFSAPLIAASVLMVPILAASRDDHASKHLLTALQFRR